jgi:hypothetical protein
MKKSEIQKFMFAQFLAPILSLVQFLCVVGLGLLSGVLWFISLIFVVACAVMIFYLAVVQFLAAYRIYKNGLGCGCHERK